MFRNIQQMIKQTNRFCVEIKKFVLLNKISLSLEIVIWEKKNIGHFGERCKSKEITSLDYNFIGVHVGSVIDA